MRQNVKRRPKDYVISGVWPDAQLEAFAPAEYAESFARRLASVVEGLSMREVGRRANLDSQTISALLKGTSWPDTVSVAKLEAAFDRLLWPSDFERRQILRAVVGESPEYRRDRRRVELQTASSAIEAGWEAFFTEFPDEQQRVDPDATSTRNVQDRAEI